jgi:AraC-like DNA-binding protein
LIRRRVLDRTLARKSFHAMRDKGWSGRLWLGRDWWGFEGASGDSRTHGHLCAQVVAGLNGPVRVETEQGLVEAAVIAIAPGVRHRLLASEGLRAVYPRPLGRLARRWNVGGWATPVAAAPTEWTTVLTSERLDEALDAETALGEAETIDPRLRTVLDALDGDLDLAELAGRVGLSPARLRALALAELAAPLAHWRLWLRLETAMLSVRAGESLAAAAAEAGFVDQSHLNRAMRRFFGVTPLTALQLMNVR